MQNEPRGQHFVPQLLLRGFASRVTVRQQKKQHYTWQYNRGIEAHEPNVKNVARMRDFHGDPRHSDLERETAGFEGTFGSVVNDLRTTRCLVSGQLSAVLQFVAHLMIRTRNLRDGTAAIGPVMFDGVQRFFGDAEHRAMLVEKMRPQIEKTLSDNPVISLLATALRVPKSDVIRFGMSQIDSMPVDEVISAAIDQLRAETDFTKIAHNAHINALDNEQSILSRVEKLKRLKWVLFEYEPRTLILGDAVVLARRAQGPFDFALLVQPDFHEVAVPIAHDLLLFGSANASDPGRPSSALLNETSAATSRSWFVAARRTSVEEHLHRHTLGTRCAFLRDEDVEKLFLNATNSF